MYTLITGENKKRTATSLVFLLVAVLFLIKVHPDAPDRIFHILSFFVLSSFLLIIWLFFLLNHHSCRRRIILKIIVPSITVGALWAKNTIPSVGERIWLMTSPSSGSIIDANTSPRCTS